MVHWEQFPNSKLSCFSLFADDGCPKPPMIANGYVEHSVRYQCKNYYRLRTEGDGKTWTTVSMPYGWCWGDLPESSLLSLEPGDLDSNKPFVVSSCGPLGRRTFVSLKFSVLLRGGHAMQPTYLRVRFPSPAGDVGKGGTLMTIGHPHLVSPAVLALL